MKVVLINPDFMLYSNPSLGLAYLAAYIRERGFEVKILDQMRFEEMEKVIIKSKPEIIGFTAVSENYYRVKEFAERLRKLVKESSILNHV